MKISSQTTAVATGFYAKSQSRIFASQQVIPLLPKDILWDDGYESIGAALRQLATTKIRKIKLIAHGSHRSLTLGSVISIEDLKQDLAEHNWEVLPILWQRSAGCAEVLQGEEGTILSLPQQTLLRAATPGSSDLY